MDARRFGSSRRSVLKGAGSAGALLGLGTGFAPHHAWAASRQAATPVAGGTLTYGSGTLPQPTLNPYSSISTVQNQIIDAVYLRLLYGRTWGDGINPDTTSTEIELAVAETMTEIEPNRVWEFTLRQNIFWHDGEPVTADDLIFGVWLGLNKDAGPSGLTSMTGLKGATTLQQEGGGSLVPPYDVAVEGITKLGDYAVRIELDQARPNYWNDWGIGYWPMPAHIFAEMPIDQILTGPHAVTPVGNGAFKVADYVDGQYIELVANDDFYLGRPLLDRFIIRFGDSDAMSAAIEAREIDGFTISPGEIFDRLTSLDYLVGNAVPTSLPYGFAINRERWPDHGAGLNKAIMHAIDVDTINEQLMSGASTPSNYLFEHIFGMEQPPEGFPEYSYDLEKAAALLVEIGWDSNQELEWIMWGAPGPLEDALQAMLTEAGIRTKYKVIDVATVVDELYVEGNFDIVFADFGGAQSMEDNWDYIGCHLQFSGGGYNYARYCNEEVDALWQQGLDTADTDERKAIFDQVTLLLAEDPPQATLWRGSTCYVWNRRVQGAYPYQYQLPFRPPFERIWLAEE